MEVQYEMLPTHCKFDATAEKETTEEEKVVKEKKKKTPKKSSANKSEKFEEITTDGVRVAGTCAWYKPKKKHGFIKPDAPNGNDIFVHAMDIKDGSAIVEGDKVEYCVGHFSGRVKAIDVIKTADAPADDKTAEPTSKEASSVAKTNGKKLPTANGLAAAKPNAWAPKAAAETKETNPEDSEDK